MRVPDAAKRQWAAVQQMEGMLLDWDYTFTTNYAGSTVVAPLAVGCPAVPDTSTFVARPAVDLASGSARLRQPLCKCKGIGGRPSFISSSGESACNAFAPTAPLPAPAAEAPSEAGQVGLATTPSWSPAPEGERVNLETLLPRRHDFVDSVDLFEDSLHDFGMATLRSRVLVGDGFWMAYIRFFLRLDNHFVRLPAPSLPPSLPPS